MCLLYHYLLNCQSTSGVNFKLFEISEKLNNCSLPLGRKGDRGRFCVSSLAAITSGVKNIISTVFFTLSGHAAPKSGTRGEIREGVFSDGITGCLQPPRGTNIRSEKSCIDKIFHSSFRLKKFRKAAGVCPVLDRKYLVK